MRPDRRLRCGPIGLAALVLCIAPHAWAAPVASADYFPLVPGTSWTFSGDGDTQVRQVQPPSPPGSTRRVLRTTSGPGTGEQETYEHTASGLLQHSLQSSPPDNTLIVFSPPIVLVPALIEAGNSGGQSGTVTIGTMGMGTYSYSWTVNSIGPGSTPLGPACDVLEVARTLTITAFGDSTTEHALNRLVRGLGPVQSSGDVDGEPYSEELVASSLPFPLDTDCDGVRDDGNASGTSGDLPCAAPLVQLCDDNCRNTANPGQSDVGGLLALAANGTGDACECGDGSNDGRVNAVDAARLARVLAGRPPALPAPAKCHVLPFGPCDAAHLLRLRRALAGDPLGLVPACPAYTGVSLP
jgi:hypothetical protein